MLTEKCSYFYTNSNIEGTNKSTYSTSCCTDILPEKRYNSEVLNEFKNGKRDSGAKKAAKQNKHLEGKPSMQNQQRTTLHEEATYMAVEKRASVSGQTIRLLQCLNRHFNLIIDVIKKKKDSRQDSNKRLTTEILINQGSKGNFSSKGRY